MSKIINEELCISCGSCEPVCLVGCISEKSNSKREINQSECVECGACEIVCPVDCISEI